MFASVLAAAVTACASPDTVWIGAAHRAPLFDGMVNEAEWGSPTLTLGPPLRPVWVWIERWEGSVFIAVLVPDSTSSWTDAAVISLDTQGDGAPAPAHDDFQWDLRRVLDSSVVFRGNHGAWMPPRDDPDWRLGAARSGGGWEVRSAGDDTGWSVELKLEQAWFAQAGRAATGLALRVYDNDHQVWHLWPPAADLSQPAMLERIPARWGVARLLGPP